MPEKETLARARRAKRSGKSPSTQAGEFVREEIHHVREGKHGARSAKQAIAIGLSKARRAGVKVPARSSGSPSDARASQRKGTSQAHHRPSATRSRAVTRALEREPRTTTSKRELGRQGRRAAGQRSAASRSRAAQQAVATKGVTGLRRAARKAARTRSA